MRKKEFFWLSSSVLGCIASLLWLSGAMAGTADLVVGTKNGNVNFYKNNGGNFVQTQVLPSGTGPHGLAIADFNEDGIPDLVNTNGGFSGNKRLMFFLGNAAGGFEAGIPLYLDFEPGRGVAVGDFNNDGHADVMVAQWTGTNVQLYLGDGKLTGSNALDHFTLSEERTVGSKPNQIEAADFNEDGNLDAVVTTWNLASVAVLFGNGSGGFSSELVLAGRGIRAQGPAVADINKDGHADIAFGYGIEPYVSAYLGNGNGTFGTRIDRQAYCGLMKIADMNNDGYGDLVAYNIISGTVPYLFHIYLWNPTTGSYPEIPVTSIGSLPSNSDMDVADFNADGNNDVAMAQDAYSKVEIYYGNGQGGLTKATDIVLSSGAQSVIAAELDGTVTSFLTIAINHLIDLPDIAFDNVAHRTVLITRLTQAMNDYLSDPNGARAKLNSALLRVDGDSQQKDWIILAYDSERAIIDSLIQKAYDLIE